MSVSVGISGGVSGCGGVSGGVSVGVSGGCGGVGVGVGVSAGCGGSVKVGGNVGLSGGIGISGGVGVGVNSNVNVSSGLSVGVNVVEVLEPPNSTPELSDSLRSFSVCAVCTLCKSPGATSTEPAWNILNCLFAYFCTEFWCCYMCFKRKDWNCFNCRHCCTSCGKYIDTYTAC